MWNGVTIQFQVHRATHFKEGEMKKLGVMVLVRLSLAIIFALLIAALKWEYFQWGFARVRFMNTGFYHAGLIFVTVLLFSALVHPLRELYRNRRIPFLQGSIEKLISQLRGFFSKLGFQFVFWGAILVLFMVFAWNLGLLRDKNYRLNQAPVPWKSEEITVGNTPVALFNYYSRDNNPTTYLRNCAKMVQDLKDAGAKAVLVPLPSIFLEHSAKLVEEIHKTGIAVFGARNESDSYLAQLRARVGLRVGRLSMGIYDQSLFRHTVIHAIDPFPIQMYPMWGNAHDVAFEILRIYYDLPADEPIKRDGDHIVFGKLRYPVDDRGKVNVGSLSFPSYYVRVNAGYDMDLWSNGSKTARLEYASPGGSGKAQIEDNLLKYKSTFGGKIVVMSWHDLGGLSMPLSFWESQNYAQTLDNLIRGRILRQSNSGSLLIGLLSIVGCGLILYRSRLVAAVASLILFSWVTLYGSAWLFQESRILVDIPVVIASLVVSIAVFTVLRLGHEWRFGAGRGIVVPPIPTMGRGVHDSGMSLTGLAFLRKRISFSPAVAAGILVLAIVTTVLVVKGIGEQAPIESQKEVVYVTSLPTVEVQGVYIPNKEVKQ